MSLTAALRSASSGLQAAQTALGVVSDNIANVNTPGYVRKVANQQQQVVDGSGAGVVVTGISRKADQYLQSASLTASADAERWSTVSNQLDTAQTLFGDPSADTGFFSGLDQIFGAFASLADDPSSSVLRSQAIGDIQDFLTASDRIGDQLSSMKTSLESQASSTVDRANTLLGQIASLNGDINRAKLTGGDATGSETLQSQMLDELSGLMDIKVAARSTGGVDVRSGVGGVLLAGDEAAKLSYQAGAPSTVSVQAAGSATSRPMQVGSGVLRGLMDLHDNELPGLSAQLNAFTASAVDQLNAAHNDSTAVPPPTTLTGRDVGADLPDVVDGFTGAASIVLVDQTANTTTRKIDIDFDAGTISVDGAAGVAFTPDDFLDQLNTALGSSGSATFTDGKLTLTGNGAGVALDEGTSAKAGRGFSATFGLNDLVVSDGAGGYAVRSDIAADPQKLAAGKVDASAAVGAISVAPGDGRGASALAAAGNVKIQFPAAGELGALNTTLSDYAAQFGGSVGRAAAAAETRADSSEAVASEASARRQSAEGVNLDEELVNLSTYQQAYTASAKLIQAISEMFDDLFKIV